MKNDGVPSSLLTTNDGYENVNWHSYVRFLVSMLFMVGGIIVAMLFKSFMEWFLRDLTGVQRWLSDEELDRRLNLHNLVEHNSFGNHGHPVLSELGIMHDFASTCDYQNDNIEQYEDVSISMVNNGNKYDTNGYYKSPGRNNMNPSKRNKREWKNNFLKRRSLLYRLRGSLLDFINALIWTGIIIIAWLAAFFTLNVNIETLVTGVGFATILALTHANDVFKGFLNYLRILATGTFERGDIVEIAASVGSFGGSVVGVVVDVVPGALVLYSTKPYRGLDIKTRRQEAEEYYKKIKLKKNFKFNGNGSNDLIVDKWINEERYYVYISLGNIFNLPVTYHCAWKTIKQRTIIKT